VGDVSTHGFQSILNALSGRISAASAAATSADGHANTASAAATSVDARVNTVSNLVSALTSAHNGLSNVVSNLISAGGGGTSVTSNELSVLLNSYSARSAAASVHGLQSILDALSNRISAGGGGGASTTSNELSVLLNSYSARNGPTSVHGLQSIFDSLSAATSAEIGNRVSADNAVSAQAASALSAALNISINSAGGSVQALQNIMNYISNTFSAISTSFSILVNTDIILLSNLSNVISDLASVKGQTRTRTAVSLLSAATLTDIASLSLSLAAGAMYKLEGGLIFECGTSGGFAFGISLPALAAAGTYINMLVASAATQGFAGQQGGRVALSAVAAGQTVVASVSIATVNVLRDLQINGMINTSAAGTLQLMAKTSVAGASMSVRGGYIRAFRLA
jgi:hypothetical protein